MLFSNFERKKMQTKASKTIAKYESEQDFKMYLPN